MATWLPLAVGDKETQKEEHTFGCDLCLFTTTEEKYLKRHLTVHEGLRCPSCDFIGHRQHILVSHIEQVHKRVRNFKCSWCTYASSRKSDLTKHMKSNHNDEFLAQENDKNPAVSPQLKMMKNAPSQANLPIKFEDGTLPPVKVQSNTGELGVSPFMSVHDKQSTEDQLVDVRKDFLGHKCPLCPFQTTTKSSFDNHLLAVHEIVELSNNGNEDSMPVGDDSGIWEAELDPLSGEDANILKQISEEMNAKILPEIPEEINAEIMPLKKPPRTLHCTKCNYITRSGREELKEHQMIAHKGVSFKSWISCKNVILNCSRCDFTTRNGQKSLKDHENRIHDGVFFTCDLCGKSYGRKSAVNEHKKRVHEGIKRFKCAICEAPKYEKKQVEKHIRDVHPEIDDKDKMHALIKKIPESLFSFQGDIIKKEYRNPIGGKSESKDNENEIESNSKQTNETVGDPVHTESHTEEGGPRITEAMESPSLAEIDLQQPPKKVFFKCITCDFSVASNKSLSEHMTQEHKDILEADVDASHTNITIKEGFTYTLEAPTSGMVHKGEDSLTYLNKDQFYTLYLEYAPTKLQELKSEVVTSIVTLQFREKEREEAISAIEFWYSRPRQTTKERLLDVDTKSSSGLVGDVNKVARNAVFIRWSPLISAVNLQIAIRCLSTDFTSQKGVKGIPLHIQVRTGLQLRDSVIMSKHILPLSNFFDCHYVVPVGFATFVIHIILYVQIDTYDDIQSSNMVNDRAFCQIKTFCDKGAERKAREEEKRLSRQHLSSGFSASVQPRSVFQRAFDLVTEPIFFTPKARPLPAMTPPSALTMPAAPALTNSGQLALPAPSDCPSPSASAARSSAAPSAAPSAAKRSNIASARVARGSRGGGSVPPSSEDRVMIFVRQENEEIFTPLHVVPPTVLGIVRAISAKYQIDCVDIRYLFRRNARGIVARVDDDMVRYYCNGDVFLMKVLATEETASGQVFYDIILAEVALQASTSAAPRPGA